MNQPADRPLILVCNDDGYFAEGHRVLIETLSALGRVVSVAPAADCSGMSHKITLNSALRLRKLAPDRYAVDGSPVDCVHLALHGVLTEETPDLLVSGINHGANLGEDTSYSGTVAAAHEGIVHGLPAIAVSAAWHQDGQFDFQTAADLALRFAKLLLADDGEMHGSIWNINVPPKATKGLRLAPLDARSFKTEVVKRRDPRGKPYYWIGPYRPDQSIEGDTDYTAVRQGYAAITPLKVQMTDRKALRSLGDGAALLSQLADGGDHHL